MILLADGDLHARQRLAARLAPRIGSLRLVLCGRALAFAGGDRDGAVVAGSAGSSVWMLFVPITLTSIGDGLSQPAAMASALSIYPAAGRHRLGADGLPADGGGGARHDLGRALLPHDSALGLIAVVGGFIARGVSPPAFSRVALPARGGRPILRAIAARRGRCRRQFAASTGRNRHDRRNP